MLISPLLVKHRRQHLAPNTHKEARNYRAQYLSPALLLQGLSILTFTGKACHEPRFKVKPLAQLAFFHYYNIAIGQAFYTAVNSQYFPLLLPDHL